MQTNLKSLFAGKREAVEVPPKRGPGRPPKLRESTAVEQTDAVVEALQSIPDQHEAYDERLRLRHRKRKFASTLDEPLGSHLQALTDMAETSGAELRMPGSQARDSSHEGPQVRLRLCNWVQKTHEDLGGTDEVWDVVVNAVAEKWGLQRADIVRILKNRDKWVQQCEARGVTATGLKQEEAHLPRYLRKSKFCKGDVKRAKGGGRQDKLSFLYPIVKDFFESMRVHGKYIDAVDLEEYLQHTMQRYLDEASKPGVAEAVEGTKWQSRVELVQRELERLRDSKSSRKVHENRQGQLMRYCGARLRRPQRLTTLSLIEERGRWQCTLQGYDRLLWEAMRPECLQDLVVNPQAFVEGIEEAVVIHADQVPCWLRIGSQTQLYGNAEVKRRKTHLEAVPHLSEAGAQQQVCEEPDGMAQTRQTAKGEGDRFRVTLEMAQVVTNVFRPSEAPQVRHARPVLIVPGAHARLSNIDEKGLIIEDEVFLVKGKQKVRKAKTAAGNLMLSWRKLRDEGDEEMKAFFRDIEVMQQPNAFADGVIIAWIAEMRRNEGYEKLISVRDMFAGGLSQSCKRMSVITGQLLSFIAGKMTPVLQITDVAVAFGFKRCLEESKSEVRRIKRGRIDEEVAFLEADSNETKCDAGDLMRILGRAWKRFREQDEVDEPDRLLKAARGCGWLSYRADPVTKALVRCDEEAWMQGRQDELAEKSHRHPSEWWAERYKWRDEKGEPCKPNWKLCGRNVHGLEYMRDEFPEQGPNEKSRLHCLQGRKMVSLPCIDLTEEEFTFPEVARNLVPQEFLKTQREKFEAARMRALTGCHGTRQGKAVRLDKKAMRSKVKRKLVRTKKKKQLRDFLGEIRARAAEGYSTRQLMRSHIPDIGTEMKISASEVTAALQTHEAGHFSGGGRAN